MNEIHPIGGPASATTLREFAQQSAGRAATLDPPGRSDRVEISDLARMLSRVAELPEDKARRVVAIRRAIQDGTYLTAEKLNIATDRLFADL